MTRALFALLVALPLSAFGQAPAPKAAPPPLARPAVSSRTPRHLVWATLAGVAAGLSVAEAGVSYRSVSPGQRATQRARVGVTFGLIGGALGAGLAALGSPTAAGGHSFWFDRWNTPLLAGIVAVQTLDYTSTRYFRDRGLPEWLLTDRLVDNRAAFVATEIAAATAAIAVAYVLHRTGHHRWERLFEGGYVAMGATSAIANYRYPAVGHALF